MMIHLQVLAGLVVKKETAMVEVEVAKSKGITM
jgi:hypothetical protein